jgi:hypothetical protein
MEGAMRNDTNSRIEGAAARIHVGTVGQAFCTRAAVTVGRRVVWEQFYGYAMETRGARDAADWAARHGYRVVTSRRRAQ